MNGFTRRASSLLLISLAAIAGCHGVKPAPPPQAINFNEPLPPGQMALRKISPGEYPDFSVPPEQLRPLSLALENSLKYLESPSSGQFYPYLDITHDRGVATCRALHEALIGSPTQDMNAVVRERFEVYKSLGAPQPDNSGYTDKVLFTGYFTPIYDASMTRTGEYQFPLHKRPADLVSDPNTGETAGRKQPNGSVIPYYTRKQIDAGALAGNELVWLKSRWDAYVITVQGSARLRLPDGTIYEVGYAGTNGYPYTSPGVKMLQAGVITHDQLTLKGLREFFNTHPDAFDTWLPINERYVFFTERKGGPFGSLNVPVTPMHTIATDKSVYPRAMPAFLIVPMPGQGSDTIPVRAFMVDQDTGGGIRASGRCDIYMGIGEGAEQLAGREYSQGELYYLAVKPELVARYLMGKHEPQ